MNEWYSEFIGDIVKPEGCFVRINLVNRNTGEIKQANISYEEIAQRADAWLNEDKKETP